MFVVGDFLRESHVYEDLLDFKALKAYMEIQLEDYNLTPGVVPMSLVLFRDAIEHGENAATPEMCSFEDKYRHV